MEGCQRERHVKLPGSGRCATCLQQTLETISRYSQKGLCNHEKLTHIQDGVCVDYQLCQSCLNNICNSTQCDHSKTEILASMKPISWSAMLVETLGADGQDLQPKIICEKTYVANSDGENILPPLWEWLKSLRGTIYNAWRGKFADVSSCKMSEEEKEAHANATHCYVCLEEFKTPNNLNDNDDEGGDVLDFVLSGQKAEKKPKRCIKVLDHCHRSSSYRGMIY